MTCVYIYIYIFASFCRLTEVQKEWTETEICSWTPPVSKRLKDIYNAVCFAIYVCMNPHLHVEMHECMCRCMCRQVCLSPVCMHMHRQRERHTHTHTVLHEAATPGQIFPVVGIKCLCMYTSMYRQTGGKADRQTCMNMYMFMQTCSCIHVCVCVCECYKRHTQYRLLMPLWPMCCSSGL